MLSVFRSPANPFLTPSRMRAFEAIGAFNPSVVTEGRTKHLFYRAMAEPDDLRTPGRGFSTIGYAVATNDDTFGEHAQVVTPTEHWESYGCEDPRAVFFEKKWYVFYTALGGYPFGPDNIRVAVALGNSPTELNEKHIVTPFNAKAATLFPERINGDAVLLLTAHTDWTADHPRPTIAIARSKNVEDFWHPDFWNEWHAHLQDHALPDVRRADTEHMEVAAAPVRIKEGWLLIYSHIQNYYDEHNRIFGVEAVLLDGDDPQKVIAKTDFPFLVPEEAYEKYGIVANVIFPTGGHVDGDTLTLYYGAADTVSAMAELSLSDLLSTMSSESRNSFMTRASDEPILRPDMSHAWESRAVFNPAAVDMNGSVHILYRAMGDAYDGRDGNISTLGYARLDDGIHVDERLTEPVYGPRESFEMHGTEDPRLTRVGDTLYLAYTAFDGTFARGTLSSISVDDFTQHQFNWTDPQPLTPENVNDKDMCVVPEPINGKTMIMHRIDPNICADYFDSLPPTRGIDRCTEVMVPRPGMWDAEKIGVAAPPIRIAEGWLFIYHAVGADHVYRIGAALFDDAMQNIISRTAMPIFEPVLIWEKTGQVDNVVFSCGVVLRDDTLYMYYGGGDSAIGVATLSKKELLRRLLPKL